jgi:BolA protein
MIVSERSQRTKIKIERMMKEKLLAVYVEIIDETWEHAGHAGAASGGGHFNMVVVSERFEGVNLLDRNRLIYSALEEEMKGEIHALALKAISPSEWNAS